MTYLRKPGSVEAMLAVILHRVTPQDVEDATGKSISLFQKASNPEHNIQLSFKDAMKLAGFLMSIDPTDTIIEQHFKAGVLASLDRFERKNTPGASMEMHMTNVMVELGQAAGVLNKILDPRSPGGAEATPGEKDEFIGELIDARDAIRRALVDLGHEE